uniref:Uncharacterized protein n=1 Tax=Megaviridae environmental sample TaxID=1737588 RepID=A0A5J6VIH9_9VIRU|nr:MAG: hypothetical protein [Megaviridae environmental sample]
MFCNAGLFNLTDAVYQDYNVDPSFREQSALFFFLVNILTVPGSFMLCSYASLYSYYAWKASRDGDFEITFGMMVTSSFASMSFIFAMASISWYFYINWQIALMCLPINLMSCFCAYYMHVWCMTRQHFLSLVVSALLITIGLGSQFLVAPGMADSGYSFGRYFVNAPMFSQLNAYFDLGYCEELDNYLNG